MKNGFIKRIAAAALCAGMCIAAAGCGSVRGSAAETGSTSESSSEKKLNVVCTGFSEYDWTKNIIGGTGGAEITYLLDSGSDMHSYQPSAADIAKISGCDLFIYIGGESQEWADDALENASCKSLKLLDVLQKQGTVKEEEIKEGMQAEDEGEEAAPEYDEHVWLTPGNAELFSQAICGSLKEVDPENASAYDTALNDYIVRLEKLKAVYAETLAGCPKKTVIVADRFPFRYLADEYGLDYYAAFAGCSAETEASFETVAFLSKKIEETGAKTIFTLENSDGKLAKTVIENSKAGDIKVAELNSLQSVTAEQISEGAGYISLMEGNLEVLKQALS